MYDKASFINQAGRDQEIRQTDPASVAEIDRVQPDPSLPPEERVIQIIRQMKGNPYCYRCGGLLVKTSFRGTASLQELLEDCLSTQEPL